MLEITPHYKIEKEKNDETNADIIKLSFAADLKKKLPLIATVRIEC